MASGNTLQADMPSVRGDAGLLGPIEDHPVFANFIAAVLEQLCDLPEGKLTHHTTQHVRWKRMGWVYHPEEASCTPVLSA